MSECTERGCRRLETICEDCGRVVHTIQTDVYWREECIKLPSASRRKIKARITNVTQGKPIDQEEIREEEA
jgi:hypothetical protein